MMKIIRVFSLLLLFSVGTFAKGSDDAKRSLPFPKIHAQRMLFPETDTESLDSMFERDATFPTINPTTPTTSTPTYNPIPTPSTSPYMTPTIPDTTPTNPAMGNPITGNPAMGNPTSPTPGMGNPTSPTPGMGNPTSPTPGMGNPTSPTPGMGNPTSPTPATGNPTTSSGQSWCIANPSASETQLQVGLDYACGYGGADCSAIQQGGSCFNPDTVRDHASYAYNSYYQKNPVQTSCDFSGTATITNTDPSTQTCQYPSSSTSSSTPTPTNPTGATPTGGGGPSVFGSSPPDFGSSPPDYNDLNSSSRRTPSFTLICFLVSLFYLKVYT
ncbi:leucine-rich repeat extensin-like protein 5 [Asparagus officinalis]|nr:leucine-rich repeat extensin-like protein 5 [Asparagus officinalis]